MNINRVHIAGVLTRDVQLERTSANTAVANIGLVFQRRVKRGGAWTDDPVNIEVAIFGQRAELLAASLVRGDPVYFEGELCMDNWEDRKTGEKRSKIKIIAHEFQFVGTKRGSTSAPGSSEGN